MQLIYKTVIDKIVFYMYQRNCLCYIQELAFTSQYDNILIEEIG